MKRLFSLLFSLGLILGCLAFISHKVNATSERPYNLSFGLSSDGTYYRVTGSDYCTEANIVIPSEYDGKPVKAIGDFAFYDNTVVKSVVIPDTIESIGIYAFYSSNLKHVELGSGITYIGDYAFSSCNLTSTDLVIPDSVVTLGTRAFQHCGGVKNLTLGKGLTTLGSYAFYYSSLESISVHPENQHFSTENGVLYDKNKETLITATKNTSSILTIPESVKTICEDAFYDCESLTEITIPASVENFGNNAFYLCSNLHTAFIHCNIGKSAFSGCNALSTVILFDTVTFIDAGAFGNGSALQEVFYMGTKEQAEQLVISETRNNNLINADWVYGKYCKHFYAPVTFNESAYSTQYICSYCGRSDYKSGGCLPLVDQGYCGEHVKWALTEDGTLTIYGVGKMFDYDYGKYAPWFEPYRDDIKQVHVTWGVTSIGDFAFWLLLPLEEISIAHTVTHIGWAALQGFDETDKIVIPDSVTSMGIGVCYVNNIQEVVLSKNLTEIPSDLLSGCLNLKKVEIPEGVTTIYDRALDGCENLESVTLPQSLAEIHRYGLCELAIEEVTFPANLKFLGNYALADCRYLSQIYFEGPAPVISNSAFTNVTATAYYYPDDTWTEDVMQNYGGNITWVAMDEPCQRVILPDLQGLAPQDAIAILEEIGDFDVQLSQVYDKSIDEGYAIKTIPVAGTTVKTSASITLQISMGPEVLTMPDVRSINAENVILELGRLGFTDITVEYVTEYYSYGNVIETTPAPGETCQKDTPITLVVVMPKCEHKYVSFSVEPDCTTGGYTFQNCTLCGVFSKTNYKDPLGHIFVSAFKLDATCTKTGYEVLQCGRATCDVSIINILPISENHNWGQGEVTVPPTCSQSGVLSSTCGDCGGSKTEPIAPTEIHIYGDWTPLDQNYHQHLCTTCHVPESQPHTWDSGSLTQKPTATAPGIMTYSCTVCHGTKTEVIHIIPGDLDGNDIIDNRDVEYLLWCTLFPQDYAVSLEFGDFSGDGVIDNLDVEYLLWHTLFPEEYPLSLTK